MRPKSIIEEIPILKYFNGVNDMNLENVKYKNFLITNILEWQTNNQFTKEELSKMTIRTLERIHDNI